MGLFSAKCTSTATLSGKTAIVTGCNTGIGKYTVKDFYLRGAKVIMACRNLSAAKEAQDSIIEECKASQNTGEIRIVHLDLCDLESVRKCAKEILDTENQIDLLVNNAGVMMCPKSQTKDGFEMQFGTNHLGHFLFTLLLLPKIIESKSARIVNVASLAHQMHRKHLDFNDLNWEKKSYSSLKAYAQSKLANILFTRELAKKLKERGIDNVNAYSLHPGVIATDLGRHLDSTVFNGISVMYKYFAKPFFKTPKDGAQTTIYCSLDAKCANETGLYYKECAATEPSNYAKSEEDAARLWEVSCDLVKLDKNYDPFKKA